MSAGTYLCAVADVPDGGSAGFVADKDGCRRAYMAIRRGGRVHVYVNSCPHVGAPLDFRPGQFLNLARTHILCSNHGAMFRIEDGHCVSGPCAGRALEAPAMRIKDAAVYLI